MVATDREGRRALFHRKTAASDHGPENRRSMVANGLPFARLSFFARRSRLVRSLVIAALFALLASVDLATSPDLSFLIFYLLPVLLASWFLGKRAGVLMSMASVATWVLDDFLSGRIYPKPIVEIWNHTAEFAFFIFLAWLVGTLKIAFEREVRSRTEHLEADLAMARHVQTSLLPPVHQDAGRFSVAAQCRQAFGVGGDLYDIQKVGADGLFVAVADVSGKGMAAALLMSSFLASLRLLLPVHANRLDTLAEELSARLPTALNTSRFVTAFFGIVEEGWLRYVNAGHNPGFLVPPGARPAEVIALHSTGTVLGLMPQARFREERVPFPNGGLLLLYTDGLTECTNAADEEVGTARVVAITAAAGGAAPTAIVERLLDAAQTHAGGQPLGDDITVLCVRRLDPHGT